MCVSMIFMCVILWPVQITPAIALELQVLSVKGLCVHWARVDSIPLHSMWSTQVCPLPRPYSFWVGILWTLPQSSCLHTTDASFKSQASLHTVPHWFLSKYSTLPSQRFGPPVNFTLPVNEALHVTVHADEGALRRELLWIMDLIKKATLAH